MAHARAHRNRGESRTGTGLGRRQRRADRCAAAPQGAAGAATAEAQEERASADSGGCPFHGGAAGQDVESTAGIDAADEAGGVRRADVEEVDIPGPAGLPLDPLQNAYHVLKIPIYGIEEALLRWGQHFGPICRFDNTNLGIQSWVFINEPALIEHVCSRNARNYVERYLPDVYAYAMDGKGLLASTGQYNLEHRKMCKAPFQRTRLLQDFATVMGRKAGELVRAWESGGNDGDGVVRCDMALHMQRLTLDVIGEVAFSYDFGGVTAVASELAGAGASELAGRDRLLELVNISNEELGRFSTPFITRGVLEFASKIGEGCVKRMETAFTDMREMCEPMIAERRRAIQDGEDVPPDLMTDLIGTQLERGTDSYTDTELWEDIHDVMGAGHETTANTLTFALLETAMHPEVDAAVAEELERVLGGRTPTFEDYAQLPYTTAVIKEVLRLYPSIPLFPRQAREDDVLPTGQRVQAGDVVFMSAYAMGRTERFWPEPLRFEPLRYSPAEEAKRAPFTWVQFGAGPRMCLGANFAMMSTTLMYATLMQSYTFKAITPNFRGEQQKHIPFIGAWRGGLPFEYDLTIKIPGGVEMEASPRTKA